MKGQKASKQMAVTIMLPIMLILVMCFHHIPKLFHEIIGVAWLLLMVLHLYQHRQWFTGLGRGKWPIGRLINTAVNILLLVLALVVIGAGAGISNYLFRDIMPMDIQRSIAIHQVHVSWGYGLILLCGIHWGLHWQGWLGQWKKWLGLNNSAKSPSLVKYCVVAMIILGGIYSSIINQVGDRLLMKHIFATAATSLSGGAYAILLACLLGLYVLVGVLIGKVLGNRG